MSFQALTLVKGRRFGSAGRKAVMLVLADYTNDRWAAYVGQERLALEAEVSERTVRTMLSRFAREGLIERHHRRDEHGHRTSDRIELHRETIAALPAAFAGGLPADRVDQPANGLPPTGKAVAGDPLVDPLVDPPLPVEALELPFGRPDEDEDHRDRRVILAVELEIDHRFAGRPGKPITSHHRIAAWRDTVRADVLKQVGTMIEAEAALDADADPATLLQRATAVGPQVEIVVCDHPVWDYGTDGVLVRQHCERCAPDVRSMSGAP